jgi:hypothetical protein
LEGLDLSSLSLLRRLVLLLCEIFRIMPMLKRVHMREDLPKLIKGRGIPVGGPKPRTMLMFSRA